MITHRIVIYDRGLWTIGYREKEFERFATRDDAVMTALQWAENARRQGHPVELFLQDKQGRLHSIQDEPAGSNRASAG